METNTTTTDLDPRVADKIDRLKELGLDPCAATVTALFKGIRNVEVVEGRSDQHGSACYYFDFKYERTLLVYPDGEIAVGMISDDYPQVILAGHFLEVGKALYRTGARRVAGMDA